LMRTPTEVELAELAAAVFAAEELRVVVDGGAEFVEPDVGALVGEFWRSKRPELSGARLMPE